MEANPNIQAQKYLLIRQLVELDDLNLYNQIKSLLDKANPVVGSNPSGKVLTQQELMSRALDANTDIENGDYTDLDRLIEESKKW